MQVFFFTFHSPLYSRLRSAKENRCRPSADGMPVSRATRRKPFFSSCSSSFSSSSENPSGHKNTSGVSFRQSCGYTRSLLSYPPQAFPEAAESADHGHQTDFSVSGSSFVRDQGLHHSVSCLPKIVRPGRRFLFFIACAGIWNAFSRRSGRRSAVRTRDAS